MRSESAEDLIYEIREDIVLGDIDGVCIVPKDAEEEVFSLAIEKARGEKMVQKKIEEGMSAKEAFETYGIM